MSLQPTPYCFPSLGLSLGSIAAVPKVLNFKGVYVMQNFGMLLLAIYLIVVGVKMVIPAIAFPFDHMVLGVLAVAAGVLLILKK